MAHEHLLSPLKIRNRTAKNRILITGHTTGFVDEHGFPDERCVAYYRERAKGGAAVLCFGTTMVHPTSPDPHFVYNGYDPGVVPKYRAVADAVHEFGGLMLVQLGHMGQRDGGLREPLYSASEVAVQAPQSPHALTARQIEEVVEAFGQAAAYAEQGGLDGVELAVGHGQLVNLFLSPLTNQREDEWGGSMERRLAFCFAIIDRVREKTGPDFIVGARINFDDMVAGGLGEPEWLEIAAYLTDHGKLDFLNVSTDFFQSVIPGMSMPHGQYASKTAAFKRLSGLPTFTAIRFNHPTDADNVIAAGTADMVGLTRAHIADPHFGLKTMEGRIDDIRTCTGCLQMCIGELFRERPISCVYNPVTGREREWSELPPAENPGHVVVVGGGPAGLEAARVARLRGHRVTLFERRPSLGGMVTWAARAPGREEIGNVSIWLARQAEKLGVELRLGEQADEAAVLALDPDAVVIATGSGTATPHWFPANAPVPLAGGADVLSGAVAVPASALVVDEDGHMEGVTTADYLAANGAAVTLVTPHYSVGYRIDPGNTEPTLRSLITRGVRMMPGYAMARVDNTGAVITSIYTLQEERLPLPDLVVTTQRFGEDRLWRALEGRVTSLHLIGDALTPRSIGQAVYEGQRLARAI